MKRSLVISVFFFAMFAFVGCKSNAETPKPEKTKKLYSIKANQLKLQKGKTSPASFHILLQKGAKIHPKAPFRCKVSATAGLTLAKKKLGHKDTHTSKDKRNVKVPVKVTAQNKGAQTVKMNCSFFVCTKDICSRHQEKVKIATKVQ